MTLSLGVWYLLIWILFHIYSISFTLNLGWNWLSDVFTGVPCPFNYLSSSGHSISTCLHSCSLSKPSVVTFKFIAKGSLFLLWSLVNLPSPCSFACFWDDMSYYCNAHDYNSREVIKSITVAEWKDKNICFESNCYPGLFKNFPEKIVTCSG